MPTLERSHEVLTSGPSLVVRGSNPTRQGTFCSRPGAYGFSWQWKLSGPIDAAARGEALGLRWPDSDLDTLRVRITQTLTSIAWTIHFSQPKTAAGPRPIALDPMTVSLLREHRKRMVEQRLIAGDGFVNRGLVFCLPDGSPHHPERVYQAFKRALKKGDHPDIPLHGLRHRWATLALEQGVNPRVLQDLLGHANMAVTLQTY